MKAVITGIGLVSSIGNNCAEVLESLRGMRTGIAIHPGLEAANAPMQLAGVIRGFEFPTVQPHTWSWPGDVKIPRTQLRSMPPHGVYATVAMHEAIVQAGLSADDLRDPSVGMLTASAGSTRLLHAHVTKMLNEGISQCHPFSITSSICGTLNYNLAAAFGITGLSGGCVSACASSAQALGLALDQIRLGRQKTMIVVGAEDCDLYSILPFGSFRALTPSRDPHRSPCAFDRDRDGFAATGGAAVLIIEESEHAAARGAEPLAALAGWGWTSDGYNPMTPEPEGRGLERAMLAALADAGCDAEDISYINAHAPSTPAGDLAEIRALSRIFAKNSPPISSTKSQTGHALSMAGALEAAICVLALRNSLVPANLNLRNPDAAAANLNLPREPLQQPLQTALSNSSGFGGVNVALALRKP